MIVFKYKKDIQAKLEALRKERKNIGFVPTMGALHKGHLSLIEASCTQNDITVCSIFINPTQFNDLNDFRKYPVTIEQDILQLTESGTDILFLPSVHEIYGDDMPGGHYELGKLETILEGKYRSGHFQGVCQVVERLFSIVKPDKAFFGQKDYQQCLVIKKLVALKQLSVEIVIHPTIREKSGLAMSSRNMRLNDEEKERATALHRTLAFIKENKDSEDLNLLLDKARQTLTKAGFQKIDYLEVADAETLQSIRYKNNPGKSVALVAAFMGEVRLIDNMLL